MKIKLTAAILAAIILSTAVMGCRGSKNTVSSDLSDTYTSDTVDSQSESDAEGTDVSSDEASTSSDGKTSKDKKGKTSSASSSGNKNSSSGTKFGVTSTKKMPDYIKNIKSNKLTLVATGADTHFNKTELATFKTLTGIDIELDVQSIPWEQQPERVTAMVVAGKAPDLFIYGATGWPDLMKADYWQDWNKYIDMDDALWKEAKEINGDFGMYKGKRTGLVTPEEGTTMAATLAYNTKLVNEAIDSNSKLADPLDMYYKNEWTWDTLYSFVEAITDTESGIYGICLSDYSVSQFIKGTNNDIITLSGGKMTYNLENKNVVRAINFAKKFYKISNVQATWEGEKMLLNGTAGFYNYSAGMHLLYHSNEMINAVKKGKIKIVPFPRDPEADCYYIEGISDVAMIPDGAKNPYLAAAWMYYVRYKSYNINSKVKSHDESLYMGEYGWSEDIFALCYPEYYPNKFKKVKRKSSTKCIQLGERMNDFDQSTYWKMLVSPTTDTSQVIATCGPDLKEAIARYNSK